MKNIVIALSKGRILKEIILFFKKNNIIIKENIKKTRKLILSTNNKNIKIIIMRSVDIPIYIKYGFIDIGILGKDILKEKKMKKKNYFFKNLNISKCRLSLIVKNKNKYFDNIKNKKILYIATKYINITKKYFFKKNINIKIIKFYGCIELCLLLKISDAIIDIIGSKKTIKINNLLEIDKIIKISSKLIVNKISYKFKKNIINKILKLKI
ncbi:ATP phosphoribosyltransferase [Candidatus Zinderia insecticola CARI]|uniref:ATP phosphoribosyltransferase n=1 Tax=Zinderia insecticola (strain CARI) TaxID=871271 RepID=E0TJ13_ZINIC|nr:ATP phosphoribosyltransferase [Candidatus Zinderia insecticola CARI]